MTLTPAAKAALIAETEEGSTWLRLSRRVPSMSRARRRISDVRLGFGDDGFIFEEEEAAVVPPAYKSADVYLKEKVNYTVFYLYML